MAKIVDKIEKRKTIALSCKNLFVKNSIKTLTISKIVQTAGIGKGSLYDYFDNKEDIVFELIGILLQEADSLKKQRLAAAKSTREKIKIFFEFFYTDSTLELRELFKDFNAICLTNTNEKILLFQTEVYEHYNKWMQEILEEGIRNNEISEDALIYSNIFFVIAKGTFITSISTSGIINLKEDLNTYIDFIFDSMKGKK